MSAYTLAPTPTHLTATTINYNSITLTVDALPNATLDSSGYYFSRSGGGNSGWIRTNTWHDTGLTCGISYTYSVKYQNGDGVPTGSISIDTSTTSCTYDTDEDGMPDTWETQYGLNPNDPSDASQDADNDGWTNLQEYQLGYDPNNASPVKPVGIFPSGDEVSLTPTLEGSAYSDSELDPHISTQWQIAYDIDFSELTFDDTTTIDTQTIQMPLAILTPVTTYYWRVRYSDATGWSAWSDAVKFITENLDDFLDETEGIDTTDVVGSDIGTVTQAYRQSPDNFSDLPSGYQFYNGIFSFRIEDITPGDTVAVTFQLDEPLKQGDKWLKYYPNSREWDTAYGDTHILNGVGTSEVTLEFKDGGFGDIDGVANGVIVDPSGPGEIDIGNTYTISGQVTLTGAPTNVTSVFLALNGDTSEKTSGQVCAPTDVTSVLLTLNGDTSETIYPDADGNYSFVDLKGGNYTVTPSLEGYHFYPVSYSYTLLDSDQIEQDFVGVYITSSGGGGGGKGHCFIVTATFGTPMAEEVMVLSQFRDKYLLTNPIGKGFVSTYYKVSPSIADFIREHPLLKKVVRGALSPLIWFSGEMTE